MGYFVPGTVASGFAIGALALGFGAADFVIKDSLKLVDDRIKTELDDVRTAFRRVVSLDCTRRSLLRLNLVAMICKGLAAAVAGLATQGKASPVIMAIGCGALAFATVLTGVIFVSHEHLVTEANLDAVERSENAAAKDAVRRLGTINTSADAPDRPVISVAVEEQKRQPKKESKK